MPWHNLLLDDLPGEIWVDAYGFDGIYEVSNLGRVKSIQRIVSNGKSERIVKERIRKQTLVKDGRLTLILNYSNKKRSINVPELIYMSFYPNTIIGKNCCIMHKNKLKSDNRLKNLEIVTISDSHRLNYIKGLLPHLNDNNSKKHEEYLSKQGKKCEVCGIVKPMYEFELKRNVCKGCRSKYRHSKYIERKTK